MAGSGSWTRFPALSPSGWVALTPVWSPIGIDEASVADEIAWVYGLVKVSDGVYEVFGDPELNLGLWLYAGFEQSDELSDALADEMEELTGEARVYDAV